MAETDKEPSARVRFSPAPSGEMHVGSARTALFNWLFARHVGGAFLLRIEDTDASRTREEWIDGVQATLRWLGLDWDEPPVRQSARRDIYLAAAERLLESGHAYESFETPEELDAINAQRRADGLPPGYDGRARDLDPAARDALRAEGRPRTIRFRTPDEGRSSFVDAVRGEVSVEWSTIADFVIVRSDGAPLFFLANAIDDADMGITHVIRGEDLIDSTHRVLALRRALGHAEPPVYAHLPLILSADRAKLSKRHGAVAVEEFRTGGILPEALRNYLALLGWAPEDEREVFTAEELVGAFELERVTHSAAIFDPQKLEWMNGEWIRKLPLDELVERVRPMATARFARPPEGSQLRELVRIGQERSVTLHSLVEQMDFLFLPDNEFRVAEDSWARLVATERVEDLLDAVAAHLAACEWHPDAIDPRAAIKALGFDKPRKALPAVYAAVEGRHTGLPLFEAIWLLGRDRAVARLRAARARLGS